MQSEDKIVPLVWALLEVKELSGSWASALTPISVFGFLLLISIRICAVSGAQLLDYKFTKNAYCFTALA